MKHYVLRAELCNDDGVMEINRFLDDGWLVKEMYITSDKGSSYAVVLLEKGNEAESK
jgi:hypothetical protein